MTGEPESRHRRREAAEPARHEPEHGAASEAGRPDPGDRGAPDRPAPKAPPEQRRRHWHPAVPGVGAAVPAARGLGGGGRC
jgi:hypothetical protein